MTDAVRGTETKREAALGLFALLVLVGVMGALGYATYRVLGLLLELQAPVIAAIITGSVTVLVATFSVLISQWLTNQSDRRIAYRERVTPIYMEFVSEFMKLLGATVPESERVSPEPEQFARHIGKHVEKFLVVASADMIRAWTKFAEVSVEGDARASLLQLEALLRLIRQELGHDDQNLKEGELLRLFINDWDDLPAHTGDGGGASPRGR